jgi:hypothetical protein
MDMDWQEARMIYDGLNSLAEKRALSLNKLWGDLQITAVRYADMRARWALTVAGNDKIELDRQRTLAHNSFIDSCNAMSRAMASKELDISWRKRLGDHRTKEGRKMIGDFACYVHCLLALSAR